MTAGDPVDVVTGRVFTEPVVDLSLPGWMPFILERSYSSTARHRDIGLGRGWTHSFGWEIEIHRRTLSLWTPAGTASERAIPELEASVPVDGGVLVRRGWGYQLIGRDGRSLAFQQVDGNPRRLRLTRIGDRNGNAIELRYRGGALDTIIDSVGRIIRVRRHGDGHIAAFEVLNATSQGRWVAFRSYAYDSAGHLIAAFDGEHRPVRFTYDDGLLTSYTYPSGLCVIYRYDAGDRCVETWAERPGPDPSLDASAPRYLADKVTLARGVRHCKIEYGVDGYREVVTSRSTRRCFGNSLGKVDKMTWNRGVHSYRYDELGNLAAYTDPLQSTWLWERDELGRVVREIDPLGAVTCYAYDEAGERVEIVDARMNSIRYTRDARGNLLSVDDALGNVVAFSFGPRGELVVATQPNGGVTRFVYDDQGNRVEVVEPSGAVARWRYNAFGRPVVNVDARGAETRYAYNDRLELVAIHLPDGTTRSFGYDPDGHLTSVTEADGRRTELSWAGFGAVHEVRKADGRRIGYRYDREGDLVRVINERGEEHRISRDVEGRILEERTFDGRVVSYQLDAAGRIVRITNGAREVTTLAYDVCGRVVERAYADASADRFEYDELGRLVSADNGAVRCTFEYDARGRRAKDTLAFGGEVYTVESTYDACGIRTGVSTSLGYAQQVDVDVMGLPTRVLLDCTTPISFRTDAGGLEVERALPGGARIETRSDVLGRLERRALLKPTAGPMLGAGQPEWLGALPRTAVSDQIFQYTMGGELAAVYDALERRRVIHAHDALGQLTALVPEHARGEVFRYDEAGNVHEAGAEARAYGPGGRLLRKGDVEYVYDDDARLVEKRRVTPGGSEVVCRYTWNGRGLLAAIEKPGGECIEYAYDAFARRVQKRAFEGRAVRSETRFVWDEDLIAQEVRTVASRQGDPVVEERRYSFRPGTPYPLAHRDVRIEGGERTAGEWVHYVNDLVERPRLLVTGAGDVLAELEFSAWGCLAPHEGRAETPLRSPGQYADDESGLAYNRFRYYDPETGLFISPDPAGLEGGLHAFAYADNRPTEMFDPEGMCPVFTTIASEQPAQGGGTRRKSVEVGSRRAGSSDDIHPIVQQSLAPPGQGPGPGSPAGGRQPTTCGEPRALTAHIRNWERNIGRELDPNNPADHDEIKRCLGSITMIRSEERGPNNSVRRAPCENCSQLLARLHQTWGAPNPNVIRKGVSETETESNGRLRGVGPHRNFTPPHPDYRPGDGSQVHQGYGA
ncbi:RHS repeat-associated core domain-containing protein [Polyangium aurulentum]|uniref:RHS repeat-associated core domain-containing protein n=1 Tax=Polyangium aurulentum TaxID=2567896 RepID=UPI00200F8301|nr:RHS repeat-associated core domain-containing protein [Polyangium aurulentum]UQA55434.1 RHS repeat protein [Polyangium aurulentum]